MNTVSFIDTLLPLKYLHWLHIPLVNSLNEKVTGIFLVTHTCFLIPRVAADPKSVYYKIFSFIPTTVPFLSSPHLTCSTVLQDVIFP